jgi:crotonobetainyl-CoA:carnitine CoA-transferase CaiB-like acyl-CoA transferase
MLPLEGIRIIAVEQYGAGPFGTMFLTNLGAEVIKIEDPKYGGDVSRSLGPYHAEGAENSHSSLFFQQLNHNKKSLTLDLGSEEGREVFQRLAASADAVASNMRGVVPDKMGITYKQLADINPKLVCAHLTAYGRDSERAAWPGYDYMMQAEAGYFHLTGEPDGAPARFGLSMIDFMTGVTLAYAITAGIIGARQTGIGRDIDTSLFDVAMYNLNYVAMWGLNADYYQDRVPRSAHFSLTPCQLYRSKDSWIYLMCNKEKFWTVLCEKIDRHDLIEDPRFLTFKERLANRDALTPILDAALSQRTTADWMAHFDGAVPAAPILTIEEALNNPYVSKRGLIDELPIPGAEPGRLLRGPVRCGNEDIEKQAAPTLGQDTDDILQQLGYDAKQLQRLHDKGII